MIIIILVMIMFYNMLCIKHVITIIIHTISNCEADADCAEVIASC